LTARAWTGLAKVPSAERLEAHPRTPPCLAFPVSSEWAAASAAKLAPCLIAWAMELAVGFEVTSMSEMHASLVVERCVAS